MLEGDGDSICGVNRLLGKKSLFFQMGLVYLVYMLMGFIHLLEGKVSFGGSRYLSLKTCGEPNCADLNDFLFGR